MSRMRAAAALMLVVVALAGCSPQPPEVDPVTQVPADQVPQSEATDGATEPGGGTAGTWVAVDIEFPEAPTQLAAGDVDITLVNEGSIEHNVTFDGVEPAPVVVAGPGATESATVTLEAGTYQYFCSVPGHENLMSGELEVTG